MAHIVHFQTAKFDPSRETPNPINPIAGESVLAWLRERINAARYETTQPDAEDWGWYMRVKGLDAAYLVGASGEMTDPGELVDWTVQVHRHRSLIDRLMGRNKMTADDPLFALIENSLRGDNSCDAIDIEKDA